MYAILENEVLNEIKLLNASTASGLDDVSPKVVKANLQITLWNLSHVFLICFFLLELYLTHLKLLLWHQYSV